MDRVVCITVALVLLTLVPPGPTFAQGSGACPDDGTAPVPVEVAVTAVPIVVPSTTDDYFVLYVQHDRTATDLVDIPVSMTLEGVMHFFTTVHFSQRNR